VKVRLLPRLKPKRRRRRPREEVPKEIVPQDPFDAARARLKRRIPPRAD
jgi:hypothetical protein